MIITPDQLAELLGISRKTVIDRYSKQPGFPAPVTSAKKPRWLESARLTRDNLVTGKTFHDARASALTWLARRVDVLVLARISGHRDISLLHRVYYRATAAELAKDLR